MENNFNNNDSSKGRLCSLEEFINDSDGQKIDILVPKLQRSYAQGRKREKNIRETFVSQILNCLAKGEEMKLNFVYGSKRNGTYSITYELLDGQQRLTTLFLFYWYFSMVEGKDHLPEALNHFSYETRTSSRDFIKKLVESTIDVTEKLPRDSIRGKKWYTISFDKDPTVEGMLRMLDTIHEKYCAMGKPSGMLANLSKIKFYELPLDNFGLTEEIYIKMNARGLQLTPFENFKADLVKYMKDDQNPHYKNVVKMDIVGSPEVPYYLSFVQKMDSKWLNLFWSKDDKDNNTYCDKFFRFFYRYISTKYYLEVNTARAEDFRPDNIPEWDFLHKESEEQSSDNMGNIYLGFDIYKKIFDQHHTYINNIETILDTLYKGEEESKGIYTALKAPWNGDKSVMRFFEKGYTLPTGVMFCAITEYIEASKGELDMVNLKKWIRVVWNCIENQLFRNVNELVSLGRNLSEIIRLSGATKDVYKAMESKREERNYSRSLLEEIKKACMIVEQPDMDWEAAFIEAEKHPFFRGSIGWFLFEQEPKTPDAFRHRTEIIGSMFDENGIVPKLRDEHTLIIAMIKQLNDTEKMGLGGNGYIRLFITENRDKTGKTNHLKTLLNEKSFIQEMLCRIGDMPTEEDAVKEIIRIAKEDNVSFTDNDKRLDNEIVKSKISKAFHRLATDAKIYDFIQENEDAGYVVSFTYLDNKDYVVHVAHSPYKKLFIDSKRREIVLQISKELGYVFADENQQNFYKKYEDYFGNRIVLTKVISEEKQIEIAFVQADTIEVSVLNPSDEFLGECSMGYEKDENGWAQLKIVNDETMKDYNKIAEGLNKIQQLYNV